MRIARAPGFQPAEAGGEDEKARIGVSPSKETNTGRGRRCLPPATWTLAAISYSRTGGSNPLRGTFYVIQRFIYQLWVPSSFHS